MSRTSFLHRSYLREGGVTRSVLLRIAGTHLDSYRRAVGKGLFIWQPGGNVSWVEWTLGSRCCSSGTLAEFKILGTFSPVTGKATLVVGVQPGVTRTTNYYVKFVFQSNSTAQSNHPTFSGSFDYVRRATGEPVPDSTGKVTATRCSYQTNAKAMALCGLD
jgi:hypothetical protein